MDRPGPRSYEVIQLFLELWERKKGEQAAMLAHPSDGSASSEPGARQSDSCKFAELSSEDEDTKIEIPTSRTGQAQ